MISERLKLPEDIATISYEMVIDPNKGFAKDAKFDMDGFKNALTLRAEMLKTPGTNPSKPEKYLDLSYYQRAITGL
jgi:hypothetical protein